MFSIAQRNGFIKNKAHALTAVILTAIIAVSSLRTALKPVPLASPWLLEPVYGVPHLRPLFVGLSLFCWGFGLWILFWFYWAARTKYEQFLFASSAIAFVLGIVAAFVPPPIKADIQFASTAAAVLSVAAALAMLFTLPTGSTNSR